MKIIRAILCAVFAAVFIGCGGGEHTAIWPGDIELLPGDIVFRRGMGATSRAVYAADASGEFSHVGIVAVIDSDTLIIHAVPDEHDFDGDYDRVKADRPEVFFSSQRAERGAICRIADAEAARKAAEYAVRKYQAGMPFDHKYDDGDTTRLYCCELVLKAYASAGVRLAPAETHHMYCPGIINADCYLPSDIYNAHEVNPVRHLP